MKSVAPETLADVDRWKDRILRMSREGIPCFAAFQAARAALGAAYDTLNALDPVRHDEAWIDAEISTLEAAAFEQFAFGQVDEVRDEFGDGAANLLPELADDDLGLSPNQLRAYREGLIARLSGPVIH